LSLDERIRRLEEFIAETGRSGVLIALSGGVDSSTLAALCRRVLGDRAVAATCVSPQYPDEEVEGAKRVAEEIGIRHVLVEVNVLEDEGFVRNSEDRCYYCKRAMIRGLKRLACEMGLKAVFEGTNISDLEGHRPGFRAILEEDGVYSPLVELGFTKMEVREVAKRLGLSVYDKPRSACLASRISFGQRITPERLRRVEVAIKALGTMLTNALFGARRSRFYPSWGVLSAVAVVSHPVPITAEPPHTREYVANTTRKAISVKELLRTGSLRIDENVWVGYFRTKEDDVGRVEGAEEVGDVSTLMSKVLDAVIGYLKSK